MAWCLCSLTGSWVPDSDITGQLVQGPSTQQRQLSRVRNLVRRSHLLSLFTHAPLVRALGFSSRPSLSQNSQNLESLHLFPLCPHPYLPTLSSFVLLTSPVSVVCKEKLASGIDV